MDVLPNLNHSQKTGKIQPFIDQAQIITSIRERWRWIHKLLKKKNFNNYLSILAFILFGIKVIHSSVRLAIRTYPLLSL